MIFSRYEGAGWDIDYSDDFLEAQVRPTDDQIFHEASEDCICHPEVMQVKAHGGQKGRIIRHHSLDGRENGPKTIVIDLTELGVAIAGVLATAVGWKLWRRRG